MIDGTFAEEDKIISICQKVKINVFFYWGCWGKYANGFVFSPKGTATLVHKQYFFLSGQVAARYCVIVDYNLTSHTSDIFSNVTTISNSGQD